MTDVVEWLRNQQTLFDLLASKNRMPEKAADEIERLRRQVSLLNGHDTLAVFQAACEEKDEEIERLRAALKDVLADYEAYEPDRGLPIHNVEILERALAALKGGEE